MGLFDALKNPAATVPRLASPRRARIIDLPDPAAVVIPLEYPGQILFRPMVAPGDQVARGQMIGRSELGNCLHASLGGRAREVRTVWSARGYQVPALVIDRGSPRDLTPAQCLAEHGLDLASARRLDLLRAGGVVSPWTTPGLDHAEDDGDGYPEVRHVVLLGVNQEPTIFNYELVLEAHGDDLRSTVRRLADIVPQAQIWLTVPRRLGAWARDTFATGVRVVELPDDYRQRIERTVVARLTRTPLPATVSYRERGVAVLSVEQALAADRALRGSPLTHKTVTIAGDGVAEPVTVRAPLGISIRDLLASQGLKAADYARVIMGGPMQGTAQYTDETPLSKFQHGIYLVSAARLPAEVNLTCVNCGRCTRACPLHLQVHLIGRNVEYDQFDQARSYHPQLCHECGLCAFVCPAHRPLVQMVKMARKYGGQRT